MNAIKKITKFFTSYRTILPAYMTVWFLFFSLSALVLNLDILKLAPDAMFCYGFCSGGAFLHAYKKIWEEPKLNLGIPTIEDGGSR